MQGSILYDGSTVNNTVADMYKISEEIPQISDGIRSATNKILSARGFKKYIGGIIFRYF